MEEGRAKKRAAKKSAQHSEETEASVAEEQSCDGEQAEIVEGPKEQVAAGDQAESQSEQVQRGSTDAVQPEVSVSVHASENSVQRVIKSAQEKMQRCKLT